MKQIILQSEVVASTSNKLLDYGTLGIVVVLMGIAIYFVVKYFTAQLNSEVEKRDKVNEKIIELVEKQTNSQNAMVSLYEKGFSEMGNKLDFIKDKIK